MSLSINPTNLLIQGSHTIDMDQTLTSIHELIQSIGIGEPLLMILSQPLLYEAFMEAREFISNENLVDICFGTYQNESYQKIFCCWRFDPGFSPRSQSLIFIYPNFENHQIEISRTDETTEELFTYNDMISWVAFGSIDQQPVGYLVSMKYQEICPYGQKKIPDYFNGFKVYRFEMPYVRCNDPEILKMGDPISPFNLPKGFGSIGLFLKSDEKVYILTNYHVLKLDETSTEMRILSPNLSRIRSKHGNINANKYIIGQFKPKLSIRGNVDFDIDSKIIPIGMDVGIMELRKRKFEPTLQYNYDPPNCYLHFNGKYRAPEKLEMVYKSGDRTHFTKATVSTMRISVREVNRYRFYSTILKKLSDGSDDNCVFCNQVMFASSIDNELGFCVNGDSGSIAIDSEGYGVALLHGSTQCGTFAFGTDLCLVMKFLETKMSGLQILSQ